MNKYILLILLLLYSSFYLHSQSFVDKGLEAITCENSKKHIDYLASDELEGRNAGSKGGILAAEYIVSYLQKLGINPLQDTYYQSFHHSEFELELKNILGIIPGKDTTEYIVLGAHYDHIGMDASLTGDQIYNGADDNASGVSGVLQIAEAFVNSGIQPEKSIIFAFWDGEEKGLLGSRYFVRNYPPIKQVKFYFNLDMIGRKSELNNSDSSDYLFPKQFPYMEKWLKEDIEKYNLNLNINYYSVSTQHLISDNQSFELVDIPTALFFTGFHFDYHETSDHADKIDCTQVVNITKATYLLLLRILKSGLPAIIST